MRTGAVSGCGGTLGFLAVIQGRTNGPLQNVLPNHRILRKKLVSVEATHDFIINETRCGND